MTIARFWRTWIEEDRLDEYEAFARDVSLPTFREQDGFEGVIMSRSGNSCMVLTLWRDLASVEQLKHSESYAAAVKAIEAQGFLCGHQAVETSEVHLFEISRPPAANLANRFP
jgi:heme-degrading monooxygenase HmoA